MNLKRNIKYRVILDETDEILASNCELAVDFAKRFLGLMFRPSIDENDALMLIPCNSVHTFFMRFPVDLVFIDQNGRILYEERNMSPGNVMYPVKDAWGVLELKGGKLGTLNIKKSLTGSTIRFEAA
ncbi:MAG: DUF192 domain-containing protein [bacterium]